MRTFVYVDGFNLYYGALKGTPWKWLDLPALFAKVLQPHHDILAVKYFTARISGTPVAPAHGACGFCAARQAQRPAALATAGSNSRHQHSEARAVVAGCQFGRETRWRRR